ncbi:unnamed protein product, partial [Mesorhabditis belari]|uniref:Uncharacterized protein n=1 Tax=Mesorhabditis belari TaxID=2138241 RepID=A0AAF3EFL1_9BILA
MPDSREPLSSAITGPQFISFNYVWPVKISLRTISVDDSVILHVSPKFATVYDHVSFQWSLKIHGTTGGLCSDEEIDSEAYPDENVPDPANYVAVELYYVDGPVNQIDVNAKFSISINPGKEPKEKTNGSRVEESEFSLRIPFDR